MARFNKGKSGNPGGRPKTIVNGVNIAELARLRGEEAIETLATIMKDTGAPPAARAKCAEALLDRGFGKSIQKSEVTGADGKDLIPNSDPDAIAAELKSTLAELAKRGFKP